MKILHLDTDDIDNPLTGGGARKNFEIYRRLAGRHEITVLTAGFPGSSKEISRDGVKYVRLGKGNRVFGLSYHFSYLSRLPVGIRAFEHDLLVEDFMAPTGGTASFLWTKKPVVANIQWLFAGEWFRKYKIPFHLAERRFLKIYKSFIVQSGYLKDKIRALNPKAEIRIITPGIDEKLLVEPFHKGEYILFIGRIDISQKGLDLLLRSYQKIAGLEPAAKLVIVGDGFEMPKLKKIIVDLGIGSRIELIGKINNEEKAYWFSRAKFVCMPSRFETFGMVAMEAFACGKPVLGFDIPALNEIVNNERGGLVPAFDEKAYAGEMLRMFRDEDEMILKGNACREFAAAFTWDRIAVRQEEFLNNCLKKE